MSTGEIIGWLNSDDAYFMRDSVAKAVEAFANDPNLDVVYGSAALVDEENRVLQVIFVPPHAEKLLMLQNFLWQPCVFFRRRSLTPPLVDERLHFGMDRDLWLRLKQEKRRFKKLPGIIAIDREHDSRKSVAGSAKAQQEWRLLDERYGCVEASWRRPLVKTLKVLFRWAGNPLLLATERDHAFPVARDSFFSLGLRQILLPRIAMRTRRSTS